MVSDLLTITDRFDPNAMQAFMRRPDMYWPSTDALAPPPEAMDFIAHLLHSDTYTLACCVEDHLAGYVKFVKRTSISAEIHLAFLPQLGGRVKKAFGQAAIAKAFGDLGLVNLWACIPSDLRGLIWVAKQVGFEEIGRFPKGIVRQLQPGGADPRRDLVLLNLSRSK